MSKKHKKKVLSEKDIMRHEEAVKRRQEKVELKQRKERTAKIISFSIFIIFFIISVGIFGWAISNMYNYETNYDLIDGEITGYETRHRTGRHTISYVLVISYQVDGQDYKFTDSALYHTYVDHLIGKTTKIYVDIDNPNVVKRAITADDLCIIGVVLYVVSVVAYIFFMVCKNKDIFFKTRLLFIWLPIIIISICFMLLCWIGLPYDNFVAVFDKIDASIGYIVISCLFGLVAMLDGIFTAKSKNKNKKI